MLGYDDTPMPSGSTASATITIRLACSPIRRLIGAGTLYGNPGQLWTQIIAVGVTIAYSAVMTFIIFMIIKVVVGLRVEAEDETVGLDESQHGERAYNS
jgi:Amt family ammonium transporter